MIIPLNLSLSLSLSLSEVHMPSLSFSYEHFVRPKEAYFKRTTFRVCLDTSLKAKLTSHIIQTVQSSAHAN